MRLGNLKAQFAITIPIGCPDLNGVCYSKEAVEKAIADLDKNIPIVYKGDTQDQEVILGHTVGESASVLWDDELQVCEVVINGNIYYGGAECFINEIENGAVTAFSISSFGLSK